MSAVSPAPSHSVLRWPSNLTRTESNLNDDRKEGADTLSRTGWSLAFQRRELEERYLESMGEKNASQTRIVALGFSLLGALFLLFIALCLGHREEMLVLGSATVVLPVVFVCVTDRTRFGKQHKTTLLVIVVGCLICLMVAANGGVLFSVAPGGLREPRTGQDIPACSSTTMAALGFGRIDLNLTTMSKYDISDGGIVGHVCYGAGVRGAATIVEVRIWKEGEITYDAQYHWAEFSRTFTMWAIFAIGTALLLSLRCVHAAISLGLPGVVLFVVYIASSPRHAKTYGVLVALVMLLPSMAMIVGVTYKLERKDRALFVEREKINKMIDRKNETIKRRGMQVKRMKEIVCAAQKTVTRVMAEASEALRPYQLKYSDIDFGDAKVCLGEGSFGRCARERRPTSHQKAGDVRFERSLTFEMTYAPPGTVYHAIYNRVYEVAVKTMRVSKVSVNVLSKFKHELIIMAPLRHENLVRLHGGVWTEGPDRLCIVLEFCSHGSLATFFSQAADNMEGEDLSIGLSLGSAKGLSYLHHDHAEPIIHRDVKPANVMVSEDIEAKLADFGESRRFDSQKLETANSESPCSFNSTRALTMTQVGTKLYCAPEIMAGDRYNESCDTFSLALVLLCLGVGEMDYIVSQNRATSNTTYNFGWRPSIPESTDKHLADLIRDMWKHEYESRPQMRYVVTALTQIADAVKISSASALRPRAVSLF